VFTHRLLHATRVVEKCSWGGDGRLAIRGSVPSAEIQSRSRLSQLDLRGPKQLTDCPGEALSSDFSADAVYAIDEQSSVANAAACAVGMGSLRPRTRNAQVNLSSPAK